MTETDPLPDREPEQYNVAGNPVRGAEFFLEYARFCEGNSKTSEEIVDFLLETAPREPSLTGVEQYVRPLQLTAHIDALILALFALRAMLCTTTLPGMPPYGGTAGKMINAVTKYLIVSHLDVSPASLEEGGLWKADVETWTPDRPRGGRDSPQSRQRRPRGDGPED